MNIIKSILKTLLFISLILVFGQMRIGKLTTGEHFVTNVDLGTRWIGKELIGSKWLAGFQVPEFIKKWIGKEAESIPQKKKRSQIEPPIEKSTSAETISKSDREAMLRLLKE